jgi:uncharacterized protein YdeI (YjbR/CyaY-like superfamily)
MEKKLPQILETALQKNAFAKTVFSKLPQSHQQEYIRWIEEAKKESTKESRVAKAIEMLLSKKEK